MNENVVINEELIAENADFLKAVVTANTIEEAQNICNEYNIVLPEDVWKNIRKSYSEGELDEDDLDAVSGGLDGGNLLSALSLVAGIGGTIMTGSALGILVACATIGYLGYKAFR